MIEEHIKPSRLQNPVAKYGKKFHKGEKHRDRKNDYSRKGKNRWDERQGV